MKDPGLGECFAGGSSCTESYQCCSFKCDKATYTCGAQSLAAGEFQQASSEGDLGAGGALASGGGSGSSSSQSISVNAMVSIVSVVLLIVIAIFIGVLHARGAPIHSTKKASKTDALGLDPRGYQGHALTRAGPSQSDRARPMLQGSGTGSWASSGTAASHASSMSQADNPRFDWLAAPTNGSGTSVNTTASDRFRWLTLQGKGSGISTLTTSSSGSDVIGPGSGVTGTQAEHVTDI